MRSLHCLRCRRFRRSSGLIFFYTKRAFRAKVVVVLIPPGMSVRLFVAKSGLTWLS
jgi:hypothetical protein